MGVRVPVIAAAMICLAFTRISLSFRVDGVISMNNTTDLATVSAGDELIFTFHLQLDVASSLNFLVSIGGDSLQCDNVTFINTVDWTLIDTTNSLSFSKKSSNVEFEEQLYTALNSPIGLAYMLNFSSGLSSGQWSLQGSYKMAVREDVTLGSLIRSVMTLVFAWTPYNTTSRTVASNYYIVSQPQDITGEARSSRTQPIMGLFTGQVTIRTSRDIGECFIVCETTPENISKEVRLTVQDMKITMNETSGTSRYALDILKNIHGSKLSSLNSYQNNVGVLNLSWIPLEKTNYSQIILASEFTFRVEDYSQLQNGDQWPVNVGAMFSYNIIWAGWISVNITAPSISMPALALAVNQNQQCAYDGSSSAGMNVLVYHSSSSTGTAYNVTVNIYLPDYMTMKKKVFTEPRENTISVRQNGTVVTAEITRLTFSDPFTLDMMLTLDLSSEQVLQTKNRIVTVEAMCNDRWGNATDIMTNTMYISLKANQVCSQKLTWTRPPSSCQCAHDPTSSDCGCCLLGTCQCGASRPKACTPCDQMWRCVPYKNGFENITYLASKDIRCDAFHMRRGSATGVSCLKTLLGPPVKYLELSPGVAVVTGVHSGSGYLYGIANNGLAYMVSQDDGKTWETILGSDYANATSDTEFTWATSN